MRIRRVSQTVTTNGGGSATQIVQANGGDFYFAGLLLGIAYVPHASTPFDATVDFNITHGARTIPLWVEPNVTARKFVCPRVQAQNVAGASVNWVGSNPLYMLYPLWEDVVTIGITNGGASKVGLFNIIYDSDLDGFGVRL